MQAKYVPGKLYEYPYTSTSINIVLVLYGTVVAGSVNFSLQSRREPTHPPFHRTVLYVLGMSRQPGKD